MKKLMLGNEAVARGAYEAGVTVISSYPGTPSTEITEVIAAKYDEINPEWAPNEKVAMEVAIGAAIGGARSMCAQKHVGLNVAADPLFTVSYTGVNGGLVIAVADDPGMHSSQNEQDSRHYAIGAKILMLEPSDSAECLEFTREAYELSEKYDTPVLLRLSTRVSHSQSLVEEGTRKDVPLKEYTKNPGKYVMMPAMARGRHVLVEKRQRELEAFADNCAFNRIEMHDKKIGIITSGIAYQYAREALGDNASYLKLGMVNPLPTEMIKKFAADVDKLYIIEELDPVIEQHVKSLGIECVGKEMFTLLGEYSPELIAEKLLGKTLDTFTPGANVPNRPPVLCPGCPHRGVFYTLNKLKLTVTGDIGCYTLGALPPLGALDACVDMGASITMLHGMVKARGKDFAKKAVGVIGDSTFMHSGMTGIANMVYNHGVSTVCILDNSITGMTGHQNNPTTGQDIKGNPATAIPLEDIVKGLGVKNVVVCDPYDLKKFEAVVKEETAKEEPSVIIARRPCALLKSVKPQPPLTVDRDKCKSCKMCMKIGCPAISMIDGKANIDKTLCVGCGLCKSLCGFGAIN